MSSVIDFAAKKQEKSAHLAGPAMCLGCKHTWAAVAPIGTTRLECPDCGTHKGVFRGTMEPENSEIWVCVCGNDVFIVQQHQILCPTCGTAAHPWAFAVEHPPCWNPNPKTKRETCYSTTALGDAGCRGCGFKPNADA